MLHKNEMQGKLRQSRQPAPKSSAFQSAGNVTSPTPSPAPASAPIATPGPDLPPEPASVFPLTSDVVSNSPSVVSNSRSQSPLSVPQNKANKAPRHDRTIGFSDRPAIIPSKVDSTAASARPASTLTSAAGPTPASAPTLAADSGVGTAITQKTPAIPAEPGIFADTPETNASKPQAFGDTTSIGNATTNEKKTYSNSDNENYSDGLGQLPLQASSSGQEATNHASIANASTDQVSPAQSAAAESATSQAATDHFAQVPPVQSAASEKALLSVSSPPVTQAPTKPESRIASAQEILDFLSAQLSIKKTYPDAAKQRHIEGKVRVGMSIAADGALKSVRVIGKSGSTILDRAAVTLVTELFPLSRQLEKAMDVAITIEYKLVK